MVNEGSIPSPSTIEVLGKSNKQESANIQLLLVYAGRRGMRMLQVGYSNSKFQVVSNPTIDTNLILQKT